MCKKAKGPRLAKTSWKILTKLNNFTVKNTMCNCCKENRSMKYESPEGAYTYNSIDFQHSHQDKPMKKG